MPNRCVVAVGGSAGGMECVREIVAQLPADFPAVVLITLHTLPYSKSYLSEILGRRCALQIMDPADKMALSPGTIYVAAPDHHLLVGRDVVRMTRGPKENNCRPAIDPLFRSAAYYGPRAIGVLVSGTLDDGSMGLEAIKRRRGIAIVQDPRDAPFPEMPQNALQVVDVDYRIAVAEIAPILIRLVHENVSDDGSEPIPDDLKFEVDMAEWRSAALEGRHRPGTPSPFSCPDCGGDLWDYTDDQQLQFRCRTGHAWSPTSLAAGQAEMVDDALNDAYRALKENEHLELRLARRARQQGVKQRTAYHEQQARDRAQSAAVLRELLFNLKTTIAEDA